MAKYYECHVTLEGIPDVIRPDVESLKWKFSAIDGDPTLGNGVKCYATRHFNFKIPEQQVLTELLNVGSILRFKHRVLREKIELVLFDSRVDTVSVS